MLCEVFLRIENKHILNNFREADQRAAEAQEQIKTSYELQFEQAQAKAQQICKQALLQLTKKKTTCSNSRRY